MSTSTPLLLAWPLALDGELPAGVDPRRILGEVRFGDRIDAGCDTPCLRVRAPCLVPAQDWRALWVTDRPVRQGALGGVSYRHTADLLFGTVAVDERNFAPVHGASALQLASAHAYRELFAALGAAEFTSLLRVWNFLPRINAIENGIERYRQFNIGRQEAFAGCGRELTGRVPAASAIGVSHGAIEIGFLATRTALDAVENPRQISAYHYPIEYGPRSPTFSRAAVARLPGQDLLFISGTASIVGHQTMHRGDIAAQTRESLLNVRTVLAEAKRAGHGFVPGVADLCCLTYVRDAADLPRVEVEVRAALGDSARVCCVQADICRADLLVEIEASGGHPVKGP